MFYVIKWALWLAWRLIQILTTTTALLLITYITGAFDELLRFLFSHFFSQQFCLTVQTRALRTHVSSRGVLVIEITDPRVLTPPIDRDGRWVHAAIGSARLMVVKLRLWRILRQLIRSRGTLCCLEYIQLVGVEGFVEGYEPPLPVTGSSETTTAIAGTAVMEQSLHGWRDYSRVQLNLTLVGGEFERGKKRFLPRYLSGSDSTTATTSTVLEKESTSPSTRTDTSGNSSTSSNSCGSGTRRLVRTTSADVLALENELRRAAATHILEAQSPQQYAVIALLRSSLEFLECAMSQLFEEAVDQIFERLRGGRPCPVPGELRLQLRELSCRAVHVHFTNLAPLALEFLERRPVFIEEVAVRNQGYRARHRQQQRGPGTNEEEEDDDDGEATSETGAGEHTWRTVDGERDQQPQSWLRLLASRTYAAIASAADDDEDAVVPDGMRGESLSALQHRMERALLRELLARLLGGGAAGAAISSDTPGAASSSDLNLRALSVDLTHSKDLLRCVVAETELARRGAHPYSTLPEIHPLFPDTATHSP